MDITWNPWAIPSLLVVVGAFTLAGIVYFTRPRRAQNRLLASYLALEGATFLWLSVLGPSSGNERTAFAVFGTGYAVWPWVLVLYLLFLSTLPTPLVRPLRRRWVRLVVVAMGAGISAAALVFPALWFNSFVQPWFGGFGTGRGLLNRLLFVAAMLVSLFALLAAIDAMRRARPGTLARAQARFLVAAFGIRDVGMVLFAISAFAVGTAFGVGRYSPLDLVVLFIWPLCVSAMHVLVAWGILRAQIFDIELRLKWTLKQSTIAAVFIGLFFVVSESAAAFFSDRVGTYLGIVAAGTLVFAIAPLQHFAQRVADRAMPGVKAVEEMSPDERLILYHQQAAAAWGDGAIDRSERALLDKLREGLGLSGEEAARIESAAARGGLG